jgi:chemosensory pili system protein ChpA (sensor histidine kinase/response regulator)
LIERLLELVDEASLLVAQAREQVAGLERSRGTLRIGGDQLQDLAGELEQLVDLRAMALDEHRARQSLDSLELDEYGELHTVSRRIAESGADGKLIEKQLGADLAGLNESLARLERLQAELRDCALRTRMAAFSSIGPRLQRTVRQAARMAGCEAALKIDGADTPIDAGMLAALVDPLAHLLRNAVDHGIEPPAERLALGKPGVGEIRLAVRRDGAWLAIVCADDGRGLDPGVVAARATALGLLQAPPDASLTASQMRALIMTPGFSTRLQASQLSGRGIGLDVVRRAIDDLGGAIELESTLGAGTRFALKVPLGLASLPVMLLRAPRDSLVLALSVRGIARILARDDVEPDIENRQAPRIEALLGLDDEVFAPEALDSFDGGGGASDAASLPRRVLMLIELPDGQAVALNVPEPEPPRSVLVRPMPALLPRVPGFDGVAVLGDGAVAPVLDAPSLFAAHLAGRLRPQAARPSSQAPAPSGPSCLVVDDSVSVRRTTENFVRDLGFQVEGAADGIEALERLRRRVPDLVLVDMEMPRMNGLELVRALRAAPRTEGVAVIMITSRYSERHKMLALEAGVDVYLTKPYTEDALASQIQTCFAVSRKPRMG